MKRISKREYSWGLNVSIALDQLIAAIFFNINADIVVSAYLGEIQWLEYAGSSIPTSRSPFKHWLQTHLDRLERHHCLRAYRKELEFRNISDPLLDKFLKERGF